MSTKEQAQEKSKKYTQDILGMFKTLYTENEKAEQDEGIQKEGECEKIIKEVTSVIVLSLVGIILDNTLLTNPTGLIP